jgi:hypothetical protein
VCIMMCIGVRSMGEDLGGEKRVVGLWRDGFARGRRVRENLGLRGGKIRVVCRWGLGTG